MHRHPTQLSFRPEKVPFALFVLVALGIGCGSRDAADQRILELLQWSGPPDAPVRFTLVEEDVTRELPTRTPAPIPLGDSLREGVLCREGVEWRLPSPSVGAAALDLSIAGLDDSPGRAVVAVEAAGEQRDLWGRDVERPREWVSTHLELPTGARRGDLVLTCRGPGTLAFSELYLTGSGAKDERPSLVLISVDTLRADHLSLSGYERLTSPHLDDLAERSLVFSHALSSSTWTLPTHATMLTGLLPAEHRANRVDRGLSGEAVTVAELLRDSGYRTAAITDGGLLDPHWGMARGFDRYDTTPGVPWQSKDAEIVFTAASRWVTENRYAPFFLFVHTYETHQPHENREGFGDPFLDPGYRGRFEDRAAPDPLDPGPISPADLRQLVGLYDGEIRRMDHYLGGFLRAVRDRLGDQVAILVTSDHGEEFLEHGDVEHSHGKVHDENVRVPLVVHLPGGSEARASEIPVTTADIVPTLLDLAGLPKPRRLAGESLLEVESHQDRVAFVHGFSGRQRSELHEERIRIDESRTSVFHDLLEGSSDWFGRRDSDPGILLSLSQPPPDSESLAERLCAALAWASEGDLAARLPDFAGTMEVAASSPVLLRGAWEGGVWRDAEIGGSDESRVAVSSAPACAVFDRAPGSRIRGRAQATFVDRGGGRHAIGLRPWLAKGGRLWSPLDRSLPPPGLLFPTASIGAGSPVEWTDEAIEELRALGYL